MPDPCRSCDRKERDWGGCRCQALALAGDASATDPAYVYSPHHARVEALAAAEAGTGEAPDYVYCTIGWDGGNDRPAPAAVPEGAH